MKSKIRRTPMKNKIVVSQNKKLSLEQMGCLQLTYEPKLKIVHSHEVKVVQMWLSTDPLAEIAPDRTPYHFVSNNPLNRIDPKGLTDYKVNGEIHTINDGHNDVSMEVSQREFNKLQRKFEKGADNYNKYMDKLSVKHGFMTSSTYSDSQATGGFGISLIDHKSGGKSYSEWVDSKDDSNMKSGSAIVGYEGMLLNKAEILIKSGAKGQSFSNLRHTSKTLNLTKNVGRGLGALGIGLTVYEDYKSNDVGWGTLAKVGIGGALLFASAPVALTYAILDVGTGLVTGTTITDRVGNYVKEKTK